MYKQIPDIDPGDPVADNEPDPKKQFKDAVAIFYNTSLEGSGVLIKPGVILTAGHVTCCPENTPLFETSLMKITNLSLVNFGHRVESKSCSRPSTLDFATITLSLENISDRDSIRNAPITPPASAEEIQNAKKGIIVGYGVNQEHTTGTKMSAKVDIEQTTNDYLYVKLANGQTASNGETDGTQPRDSGGPLYIEIHGTLKLAGICTNTDARIHGMYLRIDRCQL